MTKDEKKELFLLILESWFDDDSEQIKSDNCIGFYHYLLDCLEFELEFSHPHEDSGYHSFLSIIIDLLSKFPFYVDYGIAQKQGLKKLILDADSTIDAKKLDVLLARFQDLYIMFREEYFI